MPVKLYSYYRSSCSWRARIALAYKAIDYKVIPIHLVKNEQKQDEYREFNPIGQVPTLVDDGKVITQSMAIMEYLEEKYTGQGVSLLPEDIHQRAQVREVCEVINAGIQPIQNLSVLRKIGDGSQEWGHYWINIGFLALEKLLLRSAGKFCVGDSPSIADCVLVPQVFNANRFKIDMSQFPTISRLNEDLCKLDEFIVSHPSKQIDCPEEN